MPTFSAPGVERLGACDSGEAGRADPASPTRWRCWPCTRPTLVLPTPGCCRACRRPTRRRCAGTSRRGPLPGGRGASFALFW